MPTHVHFGAKSYGLMLAEIFVRQGFDTQVVDDDESLLTSLNEHRRYELRVHATTGAGQPEQRQVEPIRGLHRMIVETTPGEVCNADLISTAVGLQALPKLMATLAPGLIERGTPATILLCENDLAANALARAALAKHLPLNTTVETFAHLIDGCLDTICITPGFTNGTGGPVSLDTEPQRLLQINTMTHTPAWANLAGIRTSAAFLAEVQKYQFMQRMGSAIAAFHGHLHGKEQLHECMANPWIENEVRAAMWITGRGIMAESPGVLTDDAVMSTIDELIDRLKNPGLAIHLSQLAANLPGLLGKQGCFMGALRLVWEHSLNAEPILRGLATGLLFQHADKDATAGGDLDFQNTFKSKSLENALSTLCGMNKARDRHWIERIRVLLSAYRPTAAFERKFAGMHQ